MEFLIALWLCSGALAAFIANHKGGNGLLWFFIGFMCGPFGVVASMFSGSKEGRARNEVAMGKAKKCPDCAETVLIDAKVCRYCGCQLPAVNKKQWDDLPPPPPPVANNNRDTYLGLGFALLVILLAWWLS